MPVNNPAANDPLSGLLGALIGGHPAVQAHMQNTGQSLDQVLATLSNNANAASSGGATRGSFGDLLGTTMGGALQSGNAPSTGAGGDPMSALLGGLLGGGIQSGAPMQNASGAGGDPMSALLGGLLGGGMQAGAPMQNASGGGGDPMSALLGGLLGGGAQGGAGALGSNAFLAPIIDSIAAKIGVSPQTAETVASFALTQLMSAQRDPKLAQMVAGGGSVSQKYLRDSGLANQLAQQAGMDPKTAVKSLQQVLQAYGTQMGEGTMADKQSSLKALLKSK